MAIDEKASLKADIARMKESARNSAALAHELKEGVEKSRNAKGKKALQDEMIRQENTTKNLLSHVKELEEVVKKMP